MGFHLAAVFCRCQLILMHSANSGEQDRLFISRDRCQALRWLPEPKPGCRCSRGGGDGFFQLQPGEDRDICTGWPCQVLHEMVETPLIVQSAHPLVSSMKYRDWCPRAGGGVTMTYKVWDIH